MALIGRDAPRPFRRMPYAEAIAKYGSDKPDLRCGMEIADLSAAFAESRVHACSATSSPRAARCAASSVPGAAQLLAPRARRARRAGEAARRRRAGLGAARRGRRAELGAQGGGGAGDPARARAGGRRSGRSAADGRRSARPRPRRLLGQLRLHIAKKENLLDPERVRVPLGRRFPDVRVGRGGAALRVHAPPVHVAARERSPACSKPSRDGRARGPTTWC